MSKATNISLSDQELLHRYRQDGQSEWLGVFLERYTLLLFGVCMKYLKHEEDARDSVQQIFLKVIDEAKKYEIGYPKSWLYMVAKNHCLMKLRGSQKFQIQEIPDDAALADEPAEQHWQEKEISYDRLAMGLKMLNNDQRQCVTLFYLEKKSYQEIAEIAGYNIMQVKSHIQNGKRNLKIHIQRMQDHE